MPDADLRNALHDAIELADEGWGYVHGHFKRKTDYDARIAALRRLEQQAADELTAVRAERDLANERLDRLHALYLQRQAAALVVRTSTDAQRNNEPIRDEL